MAKSQQTVANEATIDLNAVAVFARVVEAGSFTRAAAELRMPKSAVSRRVARLEETLGVRLLQRTTRRLHLSDAGTHYYQQASQALTGLKDAARALSALQAEPRGTVRVTGPTGFDMPRFARIFADFARRYPQVNVQIELTSRFVDLIAEGFDIGLRGTDVMRDSTLISRRIARTPLVPVASPAYLKRRGIPKSLADLAKHDCVLFGSHAGSNRWPLIGPDGERTVEVRGNLRVGDMGLAASLAVTGAGIALVPAPNVAAEISRGRLKRVLPDFRGPLGSLYLIYPSTRFVPQAVALLREHLFVELRGLFANDPD
jgi:DNA-binding transcriptional LysR family regulator